MKEYSIEFTGTAIVKAKNREEAEKKLVAMKNIKSERTVETRGVFIMGLYNLIRNMGIGLCLFLYIIALKGVAEIIRIGQIEYPSMGLILVPVVMIYILAITGILMKSRLERMGFDFDRSRRW